MQFLQTIEPPDAAAMESLGQLAAFRPEEFASAMSNPAIRDGIFDKEAPVVATLNGAAKTDPGLVAVLLDRCRNG